MPRGAGERGYGSWSRVLLEVLEREGRGVDSARGVLLARARGWAGVGFVGRVPGTLPWQLGWGMDSELGLAVALV